MDLGQLYHLLFETYEGIGILVGAGIVISIIVCVLLEIKTRKVYKNHEPEDDDDWALFEEEVLEAEAEEERKIKAEKGR